MRCTSQFSLKIPQQKPIALSRKHKENQLNLDISFDEKNLAIMGHDDDFEHLEELVDGNDFAETPEPATFEDVYVALGGLSVDEICEVPAEPKPPRKNKAADFHENTPESLAELSQLTDSAIKSLAGDIYASINESSRISFDREDIEQEVHLLIFEMRCGKAKCNLEKNANTKAYFWRVLVNDLNRRGRIVDVEPDRARDNEHLLVSKASARAVLRIDHAHANGNPDPSADGAVESSIEGLVLHRYRPSTPEDNAIADQAGAFLLMARETMPLVSHLLAHADPGEHGRRLTKNQRRSAIYKELAPWMSTEEAVEQSEALARIRGKRGPYYRKLTRKHPLVTAD